MKLLFTGDFCPAGINFNNFRIDQDLLDLLGSADAVFGNLECPVTRKSTARKGQFINLKADPETNRLTEKFTAFSLANNHILDFGEEGAQNTIDFLNSTGIKHFGFGRTPEEAALPCRLEIKGKFIALFGITQWYCGGKNKAGTCSDRNRYLPRNIKKCRKNGDFVVVMPHWNYEFAGVPSPASRRLAGKLFRRGADLIVGAHPHVVNGIETFKNKTAAYSLGNFLFPPLDIAGPQNMDPRIWESFILEYHCNNINSEDTLRIHPVRLSATAIKLMSGDDKNRFLTEFEHLDSFFKSGRSLKKAFYEQSPQIITRVSSNMKSITTKQGSWAIISRLHRIRLQDILIVIHAKIKRK